MYLIIKGYYKRLSYIIEIQEAIIAILKKTKNKKQKTKKTCYLAVPRPTFDHSQGDSLTNPMLITAFVQVLPEDHRELCNEVGFLSPPEHLVGFEPGTFRF